MSGRKKALETVISLVLIFVMVISYFCVTKYCTNNGYNRDNIAGLYEEKNNSLDMIYVGGSACFVYWEALKAWGDFGYTSYSYAADTLTPQSIKYCIMEALKTQQPRLWVIDLRPFQYGDEFDIKASALNMYRESAIRNVTDNIHDSKLRRELIDISVLNPWDRMEYYYPILKYHSWIIENLVENCYDMVTGEKSTDVMFSNKVENRKKGFYFVAETRPVEIEDCSSITKVKPLEGILNEYFIDLLDFCKESEITPLFVVHTYSEKEEHRMKYNYMKQMIEGYGFDYLNTNDYFDEMGIDASFDFYNSNHVNVFGAEKYTDFLGDYIDKKYDMPDHRNNPDFDDWNVCAQEFDEETEKNKKAILKYQKEHKDDK